MFGFLTPHAPIILPEVGGIDAKRVHKTYESIQKLARQAADTQPDVVVVISPHGPVFSDAFAMWGGNHLAGDLSQFETAELQVQCRLDSELRDQVLVHAAKESIPALEVDDYIEEEYDLPRELDYAALIPLYFLQQAGVAAPVLHIATSGLSRFEHYRMGMAVADVLVQTGRRAVIVASGDCSHRLTEDAPSGFHRDGAFFDIQLREWIEKGQIPEILFAPEDLVENAAEDVLRPLSLLFGLFDSYILHTEIISYEGPFGVGYLTAKYTSENGQSRYPDIVRYRANRIQEIRKREHPYAALARRALESHVRDGETIKPVEEMPGGNNLLVGHEKKAVFVSLKKDGELRGCIGSLQPTNESLGHEIVHYAIEAGTRDPRFFPVEEEELEDLVYSVDVLEAPEPIRSIAELDPQKYGVIVSDGENTGVLLPNLPGIDDADIQIRIAKEKAGISEEQNVEIKRFEVGRFY